MYMSYVHHVLGKDLAWVELEVQNIKGMFDWGENREDGRQEEENRVKNDISHCLVQERKQERQKMGRKIFPPGPHFFILPIWEEKVLNDVLYTDTLTLFISPTPHFIYLI